MTANPSVRNAHFELIDRLLSCLPTGYKESSVKLPNRPFPDKPKNDKWLRATPIMQDTNNVQAGAGWERTDFLFVVDVFYPLGEDTLEQLDDAEKIASSFKNKRFNGINTHEALISTQPEDGNYYHVQVEVDGYIEGIPI